MYSKQFSQCGINKKMFLNNTIRHAGDLCYYGQQCIPLACTSEEKKVLIKIPYIYMECTKCRSPMHNTKHKTMVYVLKAIDTKERFKQGWVFKCPLKIWREAAWRIWRVKSFHTDVAMKWKALWTYNLVEKIVWVSRDCPEERRTWTGMYLCGKSDNQVTP